MRNEIKSCKDCGLRHQTVLGVLCHEDATQLDHNKSCVKYKKGERLFHENTIPSGVYCINSGIVKVGQVGIEGKDHITKLYKSGDLIGFRALLSGNRFNVFAQAVEDCNVCIIDKDTFLSTLKEQPELQSKILAEACAQIQSDTDQLVNQASMSVRQRTASILLMLSDTFKTDESERVEISLTREEIANVVGTATESLIRQLADFKEEGLIESKGRKIIVSNKEKLKAITLGFF